MAYPGEGPFVAAAFFCEHLLMENDGVASAIRIVDTHTINALGADAPDELPAGILTTTFVLILKSGEAQGRQQVTISTELPSGQAGEMPPISIPARFEGADKGVILSIEMELPITQEGLYWFDVTLNQRLLTRVPLRIVYSPTRVG